MQASKDDYITVYPNLNVSVKDTKNADGTVKVAATAKMPAAAPALAAATSKSPNNGLTNLKTISHV